jgi:hypothetical protein
MKVIASFCNQKKYRNNVIVFDLENFKKQYIEGLHGNFTGLTQDSEYIYALSQKDRIFVIRKDNYRIVTKKELDEVELGHSIVINGDDLYVVSTGTDKVLQYRFDKKRKKLIFAKEIWSPLESKGDADTHHINSICFHGHDLCVSAFGKKDGEKWNSATHGYVYNISANRRVLDKIYHPHSVNIVNDDIYYCESTTKSIKKNGDTIIKIDRGYVRGLSVFENYVIFGTSSGRKTSKSTGLVNNPRDPGQRVGDCRILVYKKDSSNDYKFIDQVILYPQLTEIYDILFLQKD